MRYQNQSTRISKAIPLFFGFSLGFFLAFLMQFLPNIIRNDSYSEYLFKRNTLDFHHDSSFEDLIEYKFHEVNDTTHKNDNNSIAKQLYNEVRVLCWIMTNPENHEKKAIHVKNTWGKHCNKILFMSSSYDKNLPTIALPVKEGRNNLWAKTKEAFKYVYKNHLNDFDWFMKADDDTYVIVENLRYFLYPYSSYQPIYFGCHFDRYIKQGYMSGGAGYVLSKEALKRFIEKALPNKTKCRQESDGAEDVELGKCMENVQVEAGYSLDSSGKGRFFPMGPESHFSPGLIDKEFWYYKYVDRVGRHGLDCCSDYAISFHYVSPVQMYIFEYFIYHLRPYGITYQNQPLPEKIKNKKNNEEIFINLGSFNISKLEKKNFSTIT
ncbi:hypothetical protein PVAND_015419 [Polypedilum vanderplanki]|uniref:Glycoprotein-N-acetylgalactosamine 3-beta-galactosyltransferase 1 n=1 Tax=Polypedilum vanderplanki TaxID=319348 RepID=A0A9J6BCS3_POLVA|nr:hypothetical protein PVAND_015419 [Polypedilum vanderplanki]